MGHQEADSSAGISRTVAGFVSSLVEVQARREFLRERALCMLLCKLHLAVSSLFCLWSLSLLICGFVAYMEEYYSVYLKAQCRLHELNAACYVDLTKAI